MSLLCLNGRLFWLELLVSPPSEHEDARLKCQIGGER